MLIDQNFKNWIEDLSKNYKKAQIKAAIHVNSELIKFYFKLGEEISKTSYKAKYGSQFFEILSNELQKRHPDVKGFSHRNLNYCEAFYTKYKEITQQVVAKLQLVPWGHHTLILSKCKNLNQALFYIDQTIDQNLSRSELKSRISANVYERSQNTLNNFNKTGITEEEIKDIAMKDPYNFDFLSIREKYAERELKEQLSKNIESFLLELGTGFSYVGKEVRLFLGETEMFCDLLFYNIKEHRYLVIEIKTEKFKPEHMGQLLGYVATIDATLKGPEDKPTIGLIVCKNKDNTLAQHVINGINFPSGISEYQLSNLIPEQAISSLPTIEELENCIVNEGKQYEKI